jgi:tRNA-splicing ligase RtcB
MSEEKPLHVFGDPVDEGALVQIRKCMEDDRAVAGALMADHHLGYSMPIGGVIAYKDAISPSGVGFDIACGNKAVRTELAYSDLGGPTGVEAIMRRIQDEIAFGIGRKNATEVDHELFDSSVWKELGAEGKRGGDKSLKQKAREQLGTVGSGNHYVDLLVDEGMRVWVAVHFGSRGFGHTVASWFLAVAQGLELGERGKETDEPAMLDVGTAGGDLYIEAMNLAGEYAYAGRDAVVDQVLGILDNPRVTESVHCHHNFAWLEDGHWVVRKGATPLVGDEPAFIGGSMGDMSVIVMRKRGESDAPALNSAPHGAGRVMSRTKAAGKFRKVNEERERPDGTKYTFKRRVRDASTGVVDWPKVHSELRERGIIVLGSGADEAPEVYKDLAEVIGSHPTIEVMATLRPVGVVMAGEDVVDPYKD